MRVREDYRTLTGPEKAAILMLSIGEEQASRLFAMMDDEEIKGVSQTMTSLGTVSAAVIERLIAEFSDHVSTTDTLPGPGDSATRLLESVTGKNTVNVDEDSLVNALRNETPEIAAGVLSRIGPEQTARVLGQLPEALAQEVIMRMLRQESTQAVNSVEPAPAPDFMSQLGRAAEGRLLPAVDEHNRASAARLEATAFGFEDLRRLDRGSVQTLLRHIDKAKLALALKGASEPLRELFYSNMSARAGKVLREEVLALGPVKLRLVDEAQMYTVTLAKELDAKDEIALAGKPADDELIY